LNKIISTKKISATFLAIVLIVGTIAMISPSFMNSASAIAMENNNNFKKSFGKDVSVKYVKCNNINVNVNGFELDIGAFPDLLGGEIGAAEAETGANSFGSNGGSNNGGSSSSNSGFVFVCINNNNNSGGNGGDGGNGEDTCAVDIERCFRINLNDEQFTAVQTALTTTGINLIVGTQTPVEVNSFIELCAFLRAQADLDRSTIDNIIGQFERQVPLAIGSEIVNPLVDCIAGVLNVPVEME
jgi:hypothetical protein